MTRDEVKQLLARIDVLYPNWKPKDLSLLIDTWLEMIGEYNYADVLVALKTYIATDESGFAPSIGQLIGTMHNLRDKAQGNEMSEIQAWALVRKAVSNGIYNAEREFNNLPPVIQKAVGSPMMIHNWAVVDTEHIETVIQSNFIKSYRALLLREKENAKLPMAVRTAIETMAQQPIGLISKEDYE